jgi:hypothetical protein
MKKFYTYLTLFCFIFAFGSSDALPLQGPLLKTDAEALAYCQATSNTYVVIVWPRGYSNLNYVIKELNQHGLVKYTKRMVINRDKMFALYRSVHKNLFYSNAKKYFKPYTKASARGQLPVAALVFRTDLSLQELIALKRTIRNVIGESSYSIHINDHYHPETIEAANVVFKA